MHENRFIRLLIVFGIALAGTLLFVLFPQVFNIKNSDLLLPGFLLAAVCALIVEILWSVLDFEIFDNLVFTIIRWVIVAFSAFIAIGATIAVLGPMKDAVNESTNFTFFSYVFLCMSTACPGAMVATCLAFTRPTYDDRVDYSWSILVGYAVSFLVGLIFGLLSLTGKGFASIAPIFSLVFSILLIPASVLLFGYPLGDVGDFDGFWETIVDNFKFKKPSTSKKSSSYTSKSTKSSYSSSSTTTKKPTYTPQKEEEEEVDDRKYSFTSLKTSMYEIAKKYDGRIITLSFDSKLYLSVSNSISGHQIDFKVKGKLKAGYIENEYDAKRVNGDLTSELQTLVNDIVNEAYDKIDALREKYSNFDDGYEVDAQVGEITPY